MAMSTMQAASAKSAPKLEAPHDTCDTHMHFYDTKYPLAPTAASAPPEDGSVATYQALQRRTGITRTVVVQPTAYGKDNTCTLDGMAALGKDTARGVAVVDDRVSEAELRRLDDLGMRAARLHMLPGGAIPWEIADAVVKRVQSVGWHAQLQLNGRLLPDRERQILDWPGRVVIDHIGRIVDPVAARVSLPAPPRRHRPRVGQALGALPRLQIRAAAVRGRERARQHGEGRAGAHAVGDELAAPERKASAGRGGSARPLARLGARRDDAAKNPGRQSGRALRILENDP
jgi:hypothetical protein